MSFQKSTESSVRAHLWRAGPLLVAERGAVFPPRCLKTNQPTTLFVRQSMSSNHPSIFLVLILMFVCLPVGLGLAVGVFLLSAQATVFEMPYCPHVVHARNTGILNTMMIACGACAFFALAFWVESFFPAIFGIIGLSSVALSATIGFPLVWIREVKGNIVYLEGVCAAFLDELPEYHKRFQR